MIGYDKPWTLLIYMLEEHQIVHEVVWNEKEICRPIEDGGLCGGCCLCTYRQALHYGLKCEIVDDVTGEVMDW